ncbi:MAG: hypothetical protein U0K92_07050, partial [Treponema sp.]|nr:hypothetical protein [Treponema sp.]
LGSFFIGIIAHFVCNHPNKKPGYYRFRVKALHKITTPTRLLFYKPSASLAQGSTKIELKN